MANALYKKGKNQFLASNLQWTSTCSFGVVLVASPYSVDLVADDALADITAANRVASEVLANLSTSDGAADADDVTFSSVSGSNVFYIVGFNNTGTDATASLIFYIDTATGLTLTPNGGDINLTFDSGSIGIFEI